MARRYAGLPAVARGLCFWSVYLTVSFVVLLPVLMSPVVADDLINPFSQMAHSGTGLANSLGYGWRGATQGASFRIVGNLVGTGYNWLWVETSTRFDLNMTTLYSVTKYVVLIGVSLAVARFAFVVARAFLRPFRYRDCVVLVAAPLFGFLQIHALWSNDPVANYTLSGFGSAILGFLAMSEAVAAVERPSWRRWVLATSLATVAVLYYEMTIGAVLGGSLVIAMAGWSALRSRRDWRLLAAGVWYAVVPFAFVVYGRTVTAGQTDTYAGTTVRVAGSAAAFGRGLAGALPGAAWRVSVDALGGHVAMIMRLLPVTCIVIVVVMVWARSFRPRLAATQRTAPSSVLVASLVAPLVYVVFGVGIQAVTVQVQDQTLRVGYVYTSYAVGACAVALVTAWIASRLLTDLRSNVLRAGVVVMASLFLLTQMTINWRLNEQIRAQQWRSVELLDRFDEGAPEAERCQALAEWAVVPWPDYYETDMIDGLQLAYRAAFGVPFCDGFVRPLT